MPVLRKVAPRVLVLLAAAGCAIGPSYKRPQVEAPPAWRAPSKSEDSRAHVLRLARQRKESHCAAGGRAGGHAVGRGDGASSGLARELRVARARCAAPGSSWAELIKDPALQALIDTAVQNNRDVRVAIATINEFRAEYGVVEGRVLPADQRRRARGGREKIQILPGQIDGIQRRCRSPRICSGSSTSGGGCAETRRRRAPSIWRARRAGARWCSRSISDVATAYLQLRELDLDLEISQRTLASRQETLKLALRRYQQGLISELDVRQFESEVDNSAVRDRGFPATDRAAGECAERARGPHARRPSRADSRSPMSSARSCCPRSCRRSSSRVDPTCARRRRRSSLRMRAWARRRPRSCRRSRCRANTERRATS